MLVSSRIEHTNLKPDATQVDIERLCREAAEYKFAGVCVNPKWVSFCADRLQNTKVYVCTVVGFPLGANMSAVKGFEAAEAVIQGAKHVDMVVDIGALKDGDAQRVLFDIAWVRSKIPRPTILKVILEICLLTDEQIKWGCEAAQHAEADFVKTSTGFSTAGATIEHVRLMSQYGMKVKAAGGIRDYTTAMAMVEAGADILGCSSSVAIAAEEQKFETRFSSL